MTTTIQTSFAGQVDTPVNIPRIKTTDDYATITASGWLNEFLDMGYTFSESDMVLIAYGTPVTTNFFTVGISSGVYTLTAIENLDEVVANLTVTNSLTFGDNAFMTSGANGTTMNGSLITHNVNATSRRLQGRNFDDTKYIQSYEGVYNHTAFDTVGNYKTRISFGVPSVNIATGDLDTEADMAIHAVHAMLLIAQDGVNTDGIIKMLSQTQIQFQTRYAAEQVSPKYLYTDRLTTGSYGTDNTSDVLLNTNDGHLMLQNGRTDGVVGLPSLTSVEVSNLGLVGGLIMYDETLNKFGFSNGSVVFKMGPPTFTPAPTIFVDGKGTTIALGSEQHPSQTLLSGWVQLVEVPDSAGDTLTVLIQNATGTVSMTDTLTFTEGVETVGTVKPFTVQTGGGADRMESIDILNIITDGTTTTAGQVLVGLNFVGAY